MIFFSGGLDSTTLAYDVALHPYRYGLLHAADEEQDLILFTYGDPDTKAEQLEPLVDAIKKISDFPVEFIVSEMPLESAPRTKRRWETLSPAGTPYLPDILQMPFTPGMHVWLASWALNLLSMQPMNGYNKPDAMFGFVYDGLMWSRHDAGEMRNNDTSPAFIESLNNLAKVSGDHVTFSAPYLTSRMNKYMVMKTAIELGVPLKLTSSCVMGWKAECGRCCQCMARNAAWLEIQDE